jgi:hypothetical protein
LISIDSSFQEFIYSGTKVLPMLPDHRSKSAFDPVQQRAQPVEGFGYPEIVPPAGHELF